MKLLSYDELKPEKGINYSKTQPAVALETKQDQTVTLIWPSS